MRLAHISDTHFGAEDAAICAALRADLIDQAPDLIVLTGDITQRARSSQFLAARTFLDSLTPTPVLALPGNHDLPLFDLLTRFLAPYRRFRRYVCPTLSPVWKAGPVVVIGVNSTRVLRHKHGELSAELVEKVRTQLSTLSQAFKIVAMHHPLDVIAASDRRNRVRGAGAALDAWIGAGTDLFLGGHIHLPYCIGVSRGSRAAIILQAGTSASTRRRGGLPNSYNFVRLDVGRTRRMAIERRDHHPATRRFRRASTYEATCGATGWTIDEEVTFPDPP